jgi:hypothetical protein
VPVGAPRLSPDQYATCVPGGHGQLPAFCTRHVLTNAWPGAIQVSSGMVTSATKMAFGQFGSRVGGAGVLVAVGASVGVGGVGVVVAVGSSEVAVTLGGSSVAAAIDNSAVKVGVKTSGVVVDLGGSGVAMPAVGSATDAGAAGSTVGAGVAGTSAAVGAICPPVGVVAACLAVTVGLSRTAGTGEPLPSFSWTGVYWSQAERPIRQKTANNMTIRALVTILPIVQTTTIPAMR